MYEFLRLYTFLFFTLSSRIKYIHMYKFRNIKLKLLFYSYKYLKLLFITECIIHPYTMYWVCITMMYSLAQTLSWKILNFTVLHPFFTKLMTNFCYHSQIFNSTYFRDYFKLKPKHEVTHVMSSWYGYVPMYLHSNFFYLLYILYYFD